MIKEKIREYRNFARRINKWQRKEPPKVEIDPTVTTCDNCGCEHDGRFCPQCGMPVARKRLSVKNVVLNFLDVWGFGSRPMFRTIGQLFTRPGFMIRDYLNGHYLRFFPPFKMLVVLTLVFVVECHILGLDISNHIDGAQLQKPSYSTDQKKIAEGLLGVLNAGRNFLDSNPTASIILQYVFFIFAARIVFKKRGLNISETFVAHIYIACQMQLLAIASTLLTLRLSDTTFLPHNLSSLIVIPVLVYDYHQLYDVKWWSSIWRTMLTIGISMVFLLLFIVVLVSVVGIYIASKADVAGNLSGG